MARVFVWLTLAASLGLVGWAILDDWTLIDQVYLAASGLALAALSVVSLTLTRGQRALSTVAQLATEISKLGSEPIPGNDLIARSREVQLEAAKKNHAAAVAHLTKREFSEAIEQAQTGLRHISDFRNLRNMKARW